MFDKPNFDTPTQEDYTDLIDYEAFLVQSTEVLEHLGEYDEARCLKLEKRLAKNRRVCLKAALRLKRKVVVAS